MNILQAIATRQAKRKELKHWEHKITKNFKDLKVRRKLTKAQKKEILDFYKGLTGEKVPLYSHEYFYSRTGIYSKEYVPTNWYACELLSKANDRRLIRAYRDKNIFDFLFYDEKRPHSILKNMNGYYYYEGKPVSKEDAVKLCQNLDNVIIKPTMSTQGKGVQRIVVKDGIVEGKGKTVEQLFKEYKSNFIIQACIKQHEKISALNPTSVNTLRILSYRSGMEVLIIYSVIRIGRQGQVIDNQCAGGISTVIGEDGKLGKFAFGGYSEDNVLKTDSGIVLDGYQLPSYDKAIEMVKRMHMRLPYFHLIGWDIAIDESGDPVLIEYNTKPGLSQSAFGPGFGKYTERIIKEMWPRPSTGFKDC